MRWIRAPAMPRSANSLAAASRMRRTVAVPLGVDGSSGMGSIYRQNSCFVFGRQSARLPSRSKQTEYSVFGGPMRSTTGWQSTGDGSTALQRVPIERRELRDDDIAVRIDYCGVCHSDLHRIRGTFRDEGALVPGHEFTGTVTAAGGGVTAFRPGDRVAVGTLVDSCGVCAMCQAGQENFCYEGATSTYGGVDRIDGTKTKGGYSREYVLREKFAYPLPERLDPAAAAPLMCAGITMWEPLRAEKIGPDSRVAVAGLGGLGHLGVKFAAALGAEVTVLSRTPDKAEDARKLGATDLLVTTDDQQLAAARGRFDLILDTISAAHDLSPLLRLAALDGAVSVLGYPM